MPSRRSFLTTAGGLAAVGAAGPVLAQFRVEISGVGATQVPIAINRFRDEDRAPQAIAPIVRADLERSGVFRIVDASTNLDETGSPNFGEDGTMTTCGVPVLAEGAST